MTDPTIQPVQVGDTVRGFCGGMFGRESYGDKVVEAVGPDWVVAREDNGDIVFCGSPGRDVASELAEYR